MKLSQMSQPVILLLGTLGSHFITPLYYTSPPFLTLTQPGAKLFAYTLHFRQEAEAAFFKGGAPLVDFCIHSCALAQQHS